MSAAVPTISLDNITAIAADDMSEIGAASKRCILTFARSTRLPPTGSDFAIQSAFPSSETDGALIVVSSARCVQ